MKKFITPEVKVVRYDSSILCLSVGVGDDHSGDDNNDFAAPQRRSIFAEPATTTEKKSALD